MASADEPAAAGTLPEAPDLDAAAGAGGWAAWAAAVRLAAALAAASDIAWRIAAVGLICMRSDRLKF